MGIASTQCGRGEGRGATAPNGVCVTEKLIVESRDRQAAQLFLAGRRVMWLSSKVHRDSDPIGRYLPFGTTSLRRSKRDSEGKNNYEES
jgi:hypothetical protein